MTRNCTDYIQNFLVEDNTSYDPESILKKLREKPWKQGTYSKQNWGNWFHSIAPYVGRIKPAFAHWLIRICSKPDDVILDPFCGIGTVPLEADLLGRMAIGTDLNPYAVAISKAKFDRRPLEEHLKFLREAELQTDRIEIERIPSYVRQFYHERTLVEMYAWLREIRKANNAFLEGCLLGISHGHRPQHLSVYTGYILPYSKPKKKPTKYKPVLPRLITKAKRMHRDGVPIRSKGEIFRADARILPLKDNAVDVIISSPPYFSTIDYAESNKLRLAIMGYEKRDRDTIKDVLIQRQGSYLEEMSIVAVELERALKPESFCVLVLGDYNTLSRSLNTAEIVSDLFKKLGFSIHGIISDEIPKSRRTMVKWSGEQGMKSHRKKMDRILIMRSHG